MELADLHSELELQLMDLDLYEYGPTSGSERAAIKRSHEIIAELLGRIVRLEELRTGE